MKARLLLLLSSLILSATDASAGTAVKAVMEGVWASSTSVFVSTPSQRIEVGAGGVKFADGTTQTTAAGGNTTILSGSTLAVNSGAYCTGISCRVGYSSGTLNAFSFTIMSSATYRLHYAVSITSGSSTSASTFRCFVNMDYTAGNYGHVNFAYPSAYNTSSLSSGLWGLDNCGTSAVNVSDYAMGVLSIQSITGRLVTNGTFTNSCGTQAALQTSFVAHRYQLPTATSWTLTCTPVIGVGWSHEAILYQVGK